MRSKYECCLLLFPLFLELSEECIGEYLNSSFWCSLESFFTLYQHREDECHISVIDVHRYAFYSNWFHESDHVFEKFLIDSHDHIKWSYASLSSQFIELHSALMKEWIIIGISDFKFYWFPWVIDRTKLIDTLG